jgi:hypothetical protein
MAASLARVTVCVQGVELTRMRRFVWDEGCVAAAPSGVEPPFSIHMCRHMSSSRVQDCMGAGGRGSAFYVGVRM